MELALQSYVLAHLVLFPLRSRLIPFLSLDDDLCAEAQQLYGLKWAILSLAIY